MRFTPLFSTVLLISIILSEYTERRSQAIQLQDGTVYFAHPPSLLKTTTSFNNIGIPGGTYSFTIKLPEDAGEPLQEITINQHQGGEYIRFNLQDTLVVESGSPKQQLQLKDVTSDSKTQTVSVKFDPPVSGGKTITIALKAFQNPNFEGVYLFGLTAFPSGVKSHGQFLGYGRLHFYSSERGEFFPF